MNADLEHLIILQAQDLELRRLRAELADAPLKVSAAQTARAQAEVALTEANKSLLKEETLRRSQELEVKDRQGKISRLRKQMESATSAAQIAALEHEIQFSEQTISRLEDEELASLERTDNLEIKRGQATLLLEVTTATLAAARVRAADITAHHANAIAGIEAERTALRAQIDEARLSVYDRISKAKGTGVSQAIDHKCSACQMMIRAQRWNDLTDRDPHGEFANSVFTCETCGRLLFYDPRTDAPIRWAPGEKLAAATNTTNT